MTTTTAPSPTSTASIDEASQKYQRDGYCLVDPILSTEQIERAVDAVDAVMRGEYETGKKPLWSGSLDSPTKLCKIDQPHMANRAILDTISNSELGRRTAAIVGAEMVQVWAVQLLHKPPGGDAKASVGWHQDFFYWKTLWTPESNLFTAWLALSDVREECGPMHFAVGSHRWGLLNAGDFFCAANEEQRQGIPIPAGETWQEESGAMPAGAFSLHHRLTFHGSQPNLSNIPRYSFAIHLRTEKSTVLPERTLPEKGVYDYVGHLDDPELSPVIYRA